MKKSLLLLSLGLGFISALSAEAPATEEVVDVATLVAAPATEEEVVVADTTADEDQVVNS